MVETRLVVFDCNSKAPENDLMTMGLGAMNVTTEVKINSKCSAAQRSLKIVFKFLPCDNLYLMSWILIRYF